MPTTLKHGISYPLGTVAPNVPVVLQATAESVEAALTEALKPRNARFNMPSPRTSTPGAGVAWGPLQVEVGAKADWTMNNDFCQPDNIGADGRVKILKPGIYNITAQINPAGNPGAINFAVSTNGEKQATTNRNATYGDWEQTVSVTGLYLKTGDIVAGYQANGNGVSFAVWLNITQIGRL